MQTNDVLDALEREGAAFGDTAAAVDLDADVHSCPQWRARDLIRHMIGVNQFWGSVVLQRATHRSEVASIPPPDDASLRSTYAATLSRLVGALRSTDPATPVWTWTPAREVGWVARRMAQETAVHRWDIDEAAGRSRPIDAELASDGVDEFLEHFLSRAAGDAALVGGSVHLHCTDVAGEWTARPGADGSFTVSREHAKGDCALRGPAGDLLLALWRRRGPESIDIVGDPGVGSRFLAVSPLE